MVGVDTAFIRSIEVQLSVKGLSVGKVTILCGGLDWPTSVLCGILRVSIMETCIGTLPMGLICAPSVFAGSVLIMPPGHPMASLKGIVMIGAMASQVALGVTAVAKINQTLNSDDPKIQAILNDPRPEHKPVEDKRKADAAMNEAYEACTLWGVMDPVQKVLIALAATFATLTAAATQFVGSMFFRPYGATSQIGDSYYADPPGLTDPLLPGSGSTLNVVRIPNGWLVLFVHYTAVVLWKIWSVRAASQAKAALAGGGSAALMENGAAPADAEGTSPDAEPAAEKEGEGEWPKDDA